MSMTQAQTRRPFYRRRKTCPFTGDKASKIDYKDVRLLQRYVSERGKIVPSRITAVCAKKQRELSKAMKLAHFMALIPYVVKEAGRRTDHASSAPVTRREAGPDRRRGEGQGRFRPQ